MLRACLHSGEAGRKAWQAWWEQVGDLSQALEGDGPTIKGLLPLLFSAAQRNDVELDRELLTVLRTAYVREELRNHTYQRIRHDVLSVLTLERIPTILLKGAALSSVAYGNGSLRHSHDIDLLLKADDVARGANALSSVGFRLVGGQLSPASKQAELVHSSGLPLQLHSRPFRTQHGDGPVADLWERSQMEVIVGVPARILSPADNLLHVCSQAAACASRSSLRWACDAWYIVQRHPDVKWEVLLEATARSHLALPLYVTLGYLAADLNVRIPPAVLERLAATARSDTLGREYALAGARAGCGGSYSNLFRKTSSWRSRALLLNWVLVPSPSFVCWDCNARDARLVPLCYLYRPLRFCARRLLSRLPRRREATG